LTKRLPGWASSVKPVEYSDLTSSSTGDYQTSLHFSQGSGSWAMAEVLRELRGMVREDQQAGDV
jgi:hypothetical protein